MLWKPGSLSAEDVATSRHDYDRNATPCLDDTDRRSVNKAFVMPFGIVHERKAAERPGSLAAPYPIK